MERISFFIDGEPRAKQSFRSLGRRGGYTPAQVKAWQSDVAWCAQMAMRRLGELEPMAGRLTVELTFFLGNARRIDSDNLSKCVQDGLNKITWLDDQQNVDLIIHKFICRERQGVLVEIKPNDRKVEVSLEEMKQMIDLAQYGLKHQMMEAVVS